MKLKLVTAVLLTAATSLSPISSLAQTSGLSTQEQSVTFALNALLSKFDNHYVGIITERGKADDLQNVCLHLDTGMTLKELDGKLFQLTLQVSDLDMRKQLTEYLTAVEVVAINELCPQYIGQLEPSRKTP